MTPSYWRATHSKAEVRLSPVPSLAVVEGGKGPMNNASPY
jgi:hypothetical protein